MQIEMHGFTPDDAEHNRSFLETPTMLAITQGVFEEVIINNVSDDPRNLMVRDPFFRIYIVETREKKAILKIMRKIKIGNLRGLNRHNTVRVEFIRTEFTTL